jgi:hypothetical protein
VKLHGCEVATRVFEGKRDAAAWEQEQRRALRSGEWFDPRRGRVPLSALYPEWVAVAQRAQAQDPRGRRVGLAQPHQAPVRGCTSRLDHPSTGRPLDQRVLRGRLFDLYGHLIDKNLW